MIRPAFSLYLDIIRFGAATVVVLHHVWGTLFPDFPLPWPGHHAVVAFFVLSGLVIAHATSRPDRTWRDYLQHRAARVLSVAYPALLLSALVALFVDPARPFHGAPVIQESSEFWFGILINLGFQGQTWFLNVAPPFNAPYWSLNFEVWYYVIFGLWTYGGRWRTPLALTSGILAGPRILTMLPVWLMGVALCRFQPRMSERRACVLFGVTVCAFLTVFWFDVPATLAAHMALRWPAAMSFLGEENKVVGDFLVGLIVAGNFAAAANMPTALSGLLRFKRVIAFPARLTFSVYLFHVPLFIFLIAGLNLTSPLLIAVLLIGGIVALGYVSELQSPRIRVALAKLGIGRAPG